jgi:hypothetical protein
MYEVMEDGKKEDQIHRGIERLIKTPSLQLNAKTQTQKVKVATVCTHPNMQDMQKRL